MDIAGTQTPKILVVNDPTTSKLATSGKSPTIKLCVICHSHKNNQKLFGPLGKVYRDKLSRNFRTLKKSESKVICFGCKLQLKAIYDDQKAIKALEAKIERTVGYLKMLRDGGMDRGAVVQDDWQLFVPNEDRVDAVGRWASENCRLWDVRC